MKRSTAFLPLLAIILTSIVADAQVNTRKGAVLGGLAGAAAGAIIGDNNDEAGAGAAIGGALGVVAGSLFGNAQDQQVAQSFAYQRQQQAYVLQRAVSVQDVLQLTQSRVSDPVIIATIRSNGVQRPLEVADIVFLSQNGVSDGVIQTMQSVGAAPIAVSYAPYAVPRTVFVDRYAVPPPIYVRPPSGHFYYHHHYGHCGPRW